MTSSLGKVSHLIPYSTATGAGLGVLGGYLAGKRLPSNLPEDRKRHLRRTLLKNFTILGTSAGLTIGLLHGKVHKVRASGVRGRIGKAPPVSIGFLRHRTRHTSRAIDAVNRQVIADIKHNGNLPGRSPSPTEITRLPDLLKRERPFVRLGPGPIKRTVRTHHKSSVGKGPFHPDNAPSRRHIGPL